MKTKITFFLLFITALSNAQLVNRLSEDKNFTDIKFTSSNIGYACNSTNFYKTTDRGLTWKSNTAPALLPLSCLFFFNDNTGFASGQNFTGSATPGLVKTTDGGATWNNYTIPVSGNERIDAIFFTDIYIGYVAGQGGKIYRTTDGGTSWTVVYTGATEFKDIFFLSASLGFAVGSNGTILKTTNGITWTPKTSGVVSGGFITSVRFISPTVGFATANNGAGTVLKTTDGGETWATAYTTSPPRFLNDIAVTDNTIFIAGSQGAFNPNENVLLTSTDNGNNWTAETLTGPQGISAISFLTGTSGFAVGFNGIYEYNKTLSVNDITAGDKAIRVYPNPTSSVLNVAPDNGINTSYVVFDQLGRSVKEGNLQLTDFQIDCTSLSQGMYYLQLKGQAEVIKIVKK